MSKELRARVVKTQQKDGRVEVAVLDPRTGGQIQKYLTSKQGAESDVPKLKEQMERKNYRVDVLEK